MSLWKLILCCAACTASYYLMFLFWELDSDNVIIDSFYRTLCLLFTILSAVMTLVVIFGVCNLGG